MLWMTYASRLLDEAHITSRGQILGHPDLMRTAPALETLSSSTKLVVLPGVDAVSEAHAATLSEWVRAGGHLILWGEDSGLLDEELVPRKNDNTCWGALLTDAGRGAVAVVNTTTVNAALGGVSSKVPDSATERQLTKQLKAAVGTPLLQTDAPSDVYTTMFKHGAGDSAVSVDLVHFSLNSSDLAPSFMLRVQVPARCTLGFFYSVEAPQGQALHLSDRGSDGFVQVEVPRFHVLGVVAFVEKGEREFRSAAARLRRLANRLTIAGRSTGADRHAATVAALRATKVLSTAQGTAHSSFAPSATLLLEQEVTRANQTLELVQTSHSAALSSANASLRASGASAVRAFKFGLGRCGTCSSAHSCSQPGNVPFGFQEVVYNDPAWNTSDPQQTHGFLNVDTIGHAITTNGDSPGGSHVVPNDNQTTFYDCFYFDYFLESSPQTFRVANLSAGEYIVTAVTGAFAEYEEVAHTAVSSPSDPGAGMLGDRSQTGVWQHRAFRVDVGSNGTLDLRFGSRNTGSLFQSGYNGWGDGMVSWAIAAMTLHRAADTHLLTPLAAQTLAVNDAIGRAALRRWRVAGPFSDRNATGLERSFPPEQLKSLSTDAHIDMTYPGGWSVADCAEAGAPLRVGWTAATLPPKGSAVAVEIPFELPHALSNGSVAVAAATFDAKGGMALLRVSTAQQAVVLLNGEVVGTKRLAAGTMPRDAEWTVTLGAGRNVLMLRLMFHYGSFQANGGNVTYESATDFTAGIWELDGVTPAVDVTQPSV